MQWHFDESSEKKGEAYWKPYAKDCARQFFFTG